MNKIAWEKWDAEKRQDITLPDVIDNQDENSEELLCSLVEYVYTPYGRFCADDPLSITNMCDCWVGHTNFPITHSIQSIIQQIDGVEVLKVITRYRFFIGVGTQFNFRDVRVEIDAAIQGKTIQNEISAIWDEISQYDHWIVYMDNMGKVCHYCTNDESDPELIQKKTDEELQTILTSDGV